MSDTDEIFGAIAETVNENTTDDGIDVVNIYATLVETISTDPDMTIEKWEQFRLSINNGMAIFNALIDTEIEKLRDDEKSR